ncbi:hypothetical protein [Azomonas agilis]
MFQHCKSEDRLTGLYHNLLRHWANT